MTSVAKERVAVTICWLAYLAGLFWFTLRPSGPSGGFQPASNVVPFKSIFDQVTTPTTSLTHKLFYLVGNLALLAPFAVLWVATLRRRARVLGVAVTAFILSGIIELIQGVFLDGRAGDIDDVILNTFGAAIVAYVALRYLRTQRLVDVRPGKPAQKSPNTAP